MVIEKVKFINMTISFSLLITYDKFVFLFILDLEFNFMTSLKYF